MTLAFLWDCIGLALATAFGVVTIAAMAAFAFEAWRQVLTR